METSTTRESIEAEEREQVKHLAPKVNIPAIICSACDIQGNVTFGKGSFYITPSPPQMFIENK